MSQRIVGEHPTADLAQNDHFLCLQARCLRLMTAHQLTPDFVTSTKTADSQQTVYWYLYKGLQNAKRPMSYGLLKTFRKRSYLNWARDRLKWIQQQWDIILFTNELRFLLQTDYRQFCIDKPTPLNIFVIKNHTFILPYIIC